MRHDILLHREFERILIYTNLKKRKIGIHIYFPEIRISKIMFRAL